MVVEDPRLGLDFTPPQIALRDILLGLPFAKGVDRKRLIVSDLTPDNVPHSFAHFPFGLALVSDVPGSRPHLKLHAGEFDRGMSIEEMLRALRIEMQGEASFGLSMVRQGLVTFQARREIRESDVTNFIPGGRDAIINIFETDFPGRQFIPQFQ